MAVGTLTRWGPVVLYMAAIAALSHQPSLRPPAGTSDWIWHVGEYAVLSALLLRALAARTGRVGTGVAAAAMIISVAYGITDEVHQSFVPGRTASAKDVLADAAGAGLSVAAALGLAARQGARAPGSPRIEITLFGRRGCRLCDEALAAVSSVTADYPVTLEKVDIEADPDLERLYGDAIPVVAINGRMWGKFRIDPVKLRRKLDSMIREREHG